MDNSIKLQGKTADLLRTNKFAIFLETVVVFAPLYLGLMISDSIGSDRVTLGGNVVLLGGPIAYLGLLFACLFRGT